MSTRNSILIKFTLFTVMLFVQIGPAQAIDLDIRSNRSSRLDFSLQIDHTRIDLDNGASTVELNLERIGIVSIEVPASGPQFGLLLGYAYADFTSNNSYESIAMDGYYLGVSVFASLIEYKNLSLALHGHYLYQSIDGKDEQVKATLSWDEFTASAMFQYRINTASQINFGIRAAQIDGRYRYNGATNVSVDLENENQMGSFVGFEYYLNRFETVGIEVRRGIDNGISLRFRKLY